MRYVRFVLSDLPLDMRKRAAVAVSDGLVRELRGEVMTRYVPEQAKLHALSEAVMAMREAIRPRDRRSYIVEVEVWEDVVGAIPAEAEVAGAAA